MLINILHPALESNIICTTVATESYEPSNLISRDIQKSRLGFMAYSCVKPPVDLDIRFAYPFDIQYITIWPSVASQKSVGFLILIENSGSAAIVGTGFITDEPGILFYRGDVFSQHKLGSIQSPKAFYKTTLRNFNKSLSDCSNITIRIAKTANSSVPAIAKIEIWGYVSKTCTRDIVTKIHNTWSKETIAGTGGIEESQVYNETEDEKHDCENISLKSNKIPEEFLDLITCDVMSIPLVLPSGNVIDQHTLDKYIKQEAVWGRPASDPFTGQPFTKYRKPFISFALKGRIEKFLSDNSEKQELFHIPRVLGYFTPDQNKINKETYNEKKGKSSLTGVQNNNGDQNRNSSIKQTSDTKLKIDHKSLGFAPRHKSTLPYNKEYFNTKVKFKQIDRSSLIVRACFDCNVNERLLKIICGHFICRTCINKSKSLKCKYCQREFSSMDVQNCL